MTAFLNLVEHEAFFRNMLNLLPAPYLGLDTGRLTGIYFCVVGLDMLGKLEGINKTEIISYILGLQLSGSELHQSGFIGSSSCGQAFNSKLLDSPLHAYVEGHVAMTYVALCCLKTLGYDIFQLDKSRILSGLIQNTDGSFRATRDSESDLRFVYCAAAICSFFNDRSCIDVIQARNYILSCISYEGGIGFEPGLEAHGGSTYCGLAALKLLGEFDCLSAEQRADLVSWCLARQRGGFCGRTNKDPDSCYCYWVGASLQLLGVEYFHDSNIKSTSDFLLTQCQCCPPFGTSGFSKEPNSFPDILHTFYSIGYLALSGTRITQSASTDLASVCGVGSSKLKSIDPRFSVCCERVPE